MIIEVTPELIVAMFQTGNEIHVRVKEGIALGYTLTGVRWSAFGNLQLVLEHEKEEWRDETRQSVVLESLPCRPA